jgi:hypothetical protein
MNRSSEKSGLTKSTKKRQYATVEKKKNPIKDHNFSNNFSSAGAVSTRYCSHLKKVMIIIKNKITGPPPLACVKE